MLGCLVGLLGTAVDCENMGCDLLFRLYTLAVGVFVIERGGCEALVVVEGLIAEDDTDFVSALVADGGGPAGVLDRV